MCFAIEAIVLFHIFFEISYIHIFFFHWNFCFCHLLFSHFTFHFSHFMVFVVLFVGEYPFFFVHIFIFFKIATLAFSYVYYVALLVVRHTAIYLFYFVFFISSDGEFQTNIRRIFIFFLALFLPLFHFKLKWRKKKKLEKGLISFAYTYHSIHIFVFS